MDLDYFFAQIEEIRKPELKGKPIVVCVYSGRSQDSGAVSTSNYLARALGIKSSMPIAFAKKKASSETIFLPVDMNYYSQVSDRIMSLLSSFSPVLEQASIDEAYLDVTQQTQGDFNKAKSLAEKIKLALLEQENLTCSIGVGSNKLIAKMASTAKKPNGLTVILPSKVKEFLNPLKVEKLFGVGKKTTEVLLENKIESIEQLSKTSVQLLIDLFGEKRGKQLHERANGIDFSEVEVNSEQQQFSRIGTLKQDSKDFDFVLSFSDFLCEELFRKISEEKIFFKTVSIIAITNKLETHTKSKTLSKPSNKLNDLKEACKELLKNFLNENSSFFLRRFGVRVSNFSAEEKQKNLFEF